MTRNLVHKSKALSYALRHNPDKFGIVLDKYGWCDIETVLKAVNCTRQEVESIIAQSEKKRFEIDGNRIRATYGHSTENKIEFNPIEPPEVLYHGTSNESFSKIMSDGEIRPMRRQYVHLSSDQNTALIVGKRHASYPVIITVHAKDMFNDGFKFFHSANDGTWMCESVPIRYISA